MITWPRPPIDQRCIRCTRRERVHSEWCAECWEIVKDETTEAPA